MYRVNDTVLGMKHWKLNCEFLYKISYFWKHNLKIKASLENCITYQTLLKALYFGHFFMCILYITFIVQVSFQISFDHFRYTLNPFQPIKKKKYVRESVWKYVFFFSTSFETIFQVLAKSSKKKKKERKRKQGRTIMKTCLYKDISSYPE